MNVARNKPSGIHPLLLPNGHKIRRDPKWLAASRRLAASPRSPAVSTMLTEPKIARRIARASSTLPTKAPFDGGICSLTRSLIQQRVTARMTVPASAIAKSTRYQRQIGAGRRTAGAA